ncbi:MAG: hypothetical protein ACXVZR_03170 [Terriglobales bacterium]
MFEKILQLLALSCRHKHTSQPFAAAAPVGSAAMAREWEVVSGATTHYIVCLDCGKKIAYDWANMRQIG